MAEVTVYTRQLCGYCTAAKNLLSAKGVAYVEHDATFEPDLRKQMIQRANGATTYPQIFFGDLHVGGCDDLMALDRSGKFEAALESGGISG